MSYIAFVPARSGSKRLPGKNIKMLAGKPLVVWTLEAFVKNKKIKKGVFSTDSMDYWDIAQQYIKSNKLVLDFRTPEQAGDKVKVFDYLKQNYNNIFKCREGNFVMGLPTVPFRNSQHVAEAIALFEKRAKPVFSASEYNFPVSFAFYLDENNGWKQAFNSSPLVTGITRSQDQKKAFHPNGALYVRSIESLESLETNTLYHNALPYLMSQKDSVDIDNEIDFITATALAKASVQI